jgi:ferredoxin
LVIVKPPIFIGLYWVCRHFHFYKICYNNIREILFNRWKKIIRNMARIDASKCIGCGLCVDLCPQVFRLGRDGQSEVIAGQEKESNESVKDAVSACPAGAISLK